MIVNVSALIARIFSERKIAAVNNSARRTINFLEMRKLEITDFGMEKA
jgi:hypothetical protein